MDKKTTLMIMIGIGSAIALVIGIANLLVKQKCPSCKTELNGKPDTCPQCRVTLRWK